MARLKVAPSQMGDTPSDQIVKAANRVFYTTDELGRRIGLKKPSVLSQYRLVELMGDSAKNQTLMAMILPVTFVVSIDEDPISFPGTRRELDALIQRVEEEGLRAVQTALESELLGIDRGEDDLKN
jgi:hypothetical protein